MKVKNAIKNSPVKLAYRVSDDGQLLITTEDGHLMFVNKYDIGLSEEPCESLQSDWVPVSL